MTTIFIKNNNEWRELEEEDYSNYRVVFPLNSSILKELKNSKGFLIKNQPFKEVDYNMYYVDIYDDCVMINSDSDISEMDNTINNLTIDDVNTIVYSSIEENNEKKEELTLNKTIEENIIKENVTEENVVYSSIEENTIDKSILEKKIDEYRKSDIDKLCNKLDNELSYMEKNAIDDKWGDFCGKSLYKYSDVDISTINLDKLNVNDLSELIRCSFPEDTMIKNIPLKVYNILKGRHKSSLMNYVKSARKIKIA